MRYSTTAIVLAAMSIGEAVAGPTHIHRHRQAHEKKSPAVDWETLDWTDMAINWSEAYKAGHASKTAVAESTSAVVADAKATVAVAAVADNKVAATTTISSAAATVTMSSASSSKSTAKASSSTTTTTSSSSVLDTLWNDLVGLANDIKAFGASTSSSGSEISATGNIGSPQGSNMMKVSSASGYDFTADFINTSGNSMTVVVWNKAYSSSGLVKDVQANSGSAVAPVTPILTFSLAAGGSQMVAFDTDSLVGWAEACSDIAASGAYATSWGEASFNPGASGYDMSAIMNVKGNKYNMSISSAEAPQCTSDPTQNYWLTDTQPIGDSDGSCYIAQDTATLVVKMGGTM